MVDAGFFDLVVIGGGPIGLAAAASAADRGLSTVVLEARDFLGGHGGSGGAERQWRLQYAEPDLAALTLEARTAWRSLEVRARRTLVHETGSLWFGDPTTASSEGQIAAAARVLDEMGIAYDTVSPAALRAGHGFHGLPEHYVGLYQPQGGVIDVAAARWALVTAAQRAGCDLRPGEPVRELALSGSGASVSTSRGIYRCERVVLAAGAWTPTIAAQVGVHVELALYPLTKAWFRVRPERDFPTWFAFQSARETDSNLFYGFGRMPWAHDDIVQVSPLFESDPLDRPGDVPVRPRPHDVARVVEWVRDHMPDLDPQPLAMDTCVAALPVDHDRQFYLGTASGLVPEGDRLVIAAGGWAFKFVPVFGQACVDLAVDGRTNYGIDRIGLVGPVQPDTTRLETQA